MGFVLVAAPFYGDGGLSGKRGFESSLNSPVAQTEGRWRIIVELFRRWVLQIYPLSGE